MSSKRTLRTRLLELLASVEPYGIAEHDRDSIGLTDRLRRFYPAPAFLRALDPQIFVIVGRRGAGKSELFGVLENEGLEPLLRLARDPTPTALIATVLPEKDVTARALRGASEARLRAFWLGVLARALFACDAAFTPPPSMKAALAPETPVPEWLPTVEAQIHDVLTPLQDYDRHLRDKQQRLFVAYDRLDLLTPALSDALPAIRALLNLWLDRTYRWTRIRGKIFLRDDILRSPLLDFPDASKLLAGHQATLRWSSNLLYTLWINRVVNHPDWPSVEADVRQALGAHDPSATIETAPGAPFGRFVRKPVATARALLEFVASYHIGTPRDGTVWDWIPAQLSDAHDQVTPRAFLVLLSEAARSTLDRLADPERPWIRPDDLKAGLNRASARRFTEVREDAPWLEDLGEVLGGTWVPTDLADLSDRIARAPWSPNRPPPSTDPREVVDHLVHLGVVRLRSMGVHWPYDVPELYLKPLGVRRRTGRTPASEPDPEVGEPPAPDEVVALVDRLFCGTRGRYARYSRGATERGQLIVPGHVFRFKLVNQHVQRVSLQLYVGLDAIGGALWSRQIRALSQIASLQHPALPEIEAGDYLEAENVAYVVTKTVPSRLSDDRAMGPLLNNLPRALRHFTLLAHALSELHRRGISHLDLHPASIEYIPQGDDELTGEQRFDLRLSNFEMSSMIGNLLRQRLEVEELSIEARHRLYTRDLHHRIAYYPPERVDWIYSDETLYTESDRSDVYALGVLAWCWLVERSTDALTGIEPGPDVPEQLQSRFRDSLAWCQHLPPPLRTLIGSMLEPTFTQRPNMAKVVQALSKDYSRWSNALTSTPTEGRYYLAYMPVESKKTVHAWGWIQHDPTDPIGREELRAYLNHELRNADLLHSPGGFAPFRLARSDAERKSFQEAVYVLRGKQAYWFCDLYRVHGGAGRSRVAHKLENLLVIRYMTARRNAWQLDESMLTRKIPGALHLIPFYVGTPIDPADITDGHSWSSLVRPIEVTSAKPKWQTEIRALTFLLELRTVQLNAREFPYRLAESSGLVKVIRRDEERDRRWVLDKPMRRLYAASFRKSMGSLFSALDGERAATLSVREGDVRTQVAFVEQLDEDTIKVRQIGGYPALPPKGLISPAEDYGDRMQLRRQTSATVDLQRHTGLLQQLNDPATVPGLRTRWRGAGRELRGRGPDIVKQILTHRPFYALHGPPGSGKTTVTAHAVAANLRVDPSQRILVSSQSHHALDNLALRISAQIRGQRINPLVLRVASPAAIASGRVDEQMIEQTPERQTDRVIDTAVRAATRALDKGTDDRGRRLDGPVLDLLSDWKRTVATARDEVERRLRRGANIVFATANSCTTDLVNPLGALFDWAIVEEAARAWPTELALPLIQANRWTLIGDHLQLPAFDKMTVSRFLDACASDPDETLREHGESREVYERMFDVFGALFDHRVARRRRRNFRSDLVEPLAELDLQFRMHPDIGALVSRTFYHTRIDPETGERVYSPGGWLATDPSANRPHRLRQPQFLRDRALVWLDTTDLPDSDDRRAWKNHAEARLIKALLETFDPEPTGDEEVAILSPYREQLELMSGANLPPWAHRALHTIDSFQGREADIVIVSMVRTTERQRPSPGEARGERPAASPEANIGYLVAPERINVMLSRARRLLVIVGRASHFERQVDLFPERDDIRFWRTLIDEIKRQGGWVRAIDLGFGDR